MIYNQQFDLCICIHDLVYILYYTQSRKAQVLNHSTIAGCLILNVILAIRKPI